MSKYFGDHGHLIYLLNFMPGDIFRALYPFALFGAFEYAQTSINIGRRPDIFYMTAFYILFFSFIGHKEPRFLLPVLPFIFLMIGHYITYLFKSTSQNVWLQRALSAFLIVNMVIEMTLLTVRINF